MHLRRFVAVFLLSSIFTFSISAQDRETPVTWSLKAASTEINQSDRFTVSLTAKIENGWHLYATQQPIATGPRPTKITLPEGQFFSLVNLSEPKPSTEFDDNFKAETSWYAGEVTFQLMLTVKSDAPIEKQTLQLQTYFQSCTKEKCLAPRKEILTLSINVNAAPKRGAVVVSEADEKQFLTAMRTPDAKQRVIALEKILSGSASQTQQSLGSRAIVEALLEISPYQKEKILTASERLLNVTDEDSREIWRTYLANLWLEKNVLLEEAEKYAAQNIELRGTSVKPDSLATLGRIYLKRNKTKEGEELIKKAFSLDASLPAAMLGMGEISAAQNDHKTALDFFAKVYLSGRGGAASRQLTAEAYRKIYPNNLNELETWLDEKYRRDFPAQIKTERYQPTPKRTNRVILLEAFNGAACAPCIATDLSIEAATKRFSTNEFAVIAYHLHIPDVDPMTNAPSEIRRAYYGTRAAPTLYLNGVMISNSGGGRNQSFSFFDKLKTVIEGSLETPAAAEIKLSATKQNSLIKVSANVIPMNSNSSDLRLHLVLVEDEVRYTGLNGIRFHQMVARAMVGKNAGGLPLKANKNGAFEHTFDLVKIAQANKNYLDDYEINGRNFFTKFDEKKHEMDFNRMSVIAFVQDHKTKQIFQAAQIKLSANK